MRPKRLVSYGVMLTGPGNDQKRSRNSGAMAGCALVICLPNAMAGCRSQFGLSKDGLKLTI